MLNCCLLFSCESLSNGILAIWGQFFFKTLTSKSVKSDDVNDCNESLDSLNLAWYTVSDRSGGKRSCRPHLVQRQHCVDDRSHSEGTTDEEKSTDLFTGSSPVTATGACHLKSDLPKEIISSTADIKGARSPKSYSHYRDQRYLSSSLKDKSPSRQKNAYKTGGSLDANITRDSVFNVSRITIDSQRCPSPQQCTLDMESVNPVVDRLAVEIGSYRNEAGQRDQQNSFRRCLSETTAPLMKDVNTPARSESLRAGRGHPTYYNQRPVYDESRIASEGDRQQNNENFRYSWRGGVRRQFSLESIELEDLLDHRHHMEQERMESTTPSDDDDHHSKVRYNDVGSLEQVNEDMMDLAESNSVAVVDYDNIRVQCQALWQLRATLEEEDPEECESENGKADTMSSSESRNRRISPEAENPPTTATSRTTSFESRSDTSVTGMPQAEAFAPNIPSQTTAINILSSEERRTCYRSILAQRLRRLDTNIRPSLSAENSFDSVETDWSSTTDLSRPEVFTTSLDSTTDCPTDSTGDNHSHRLQQMKADSGYRSLETTNNKSHLASSSMVVESMEIFPESKPSTSQKSILSSLGAEINVAEPTDDSVLRSRSRRQSGWLERRNSSRLSAKKRRELLREWQHVSLDAGLALEAEANSGDEISGKRSVLARFLRANRNRTGGSLRLHHHRLLQRDYSIDEKSDRLFKEFSQPEAHLLSESDAVVLRGRNKLYTPGRRMHRHLEPTDSSSHNQRRKLSPQDSIEEEDISEMWSESQNDVSDQSKVNTVCSFMEER